MDLKRVETLIDKYMPELADMSARAVLTHKRHLESLLSVATAIGSVFDLKELLNRIMDYARRVTGAERGLLLLYNEEGRLELRGASEDVPLTDGFRYEEARMSETLAQEVIQNKDALIASAQDEAPAGKELKFYGVKQALCVPLRTKVKDLGLLYLDNRLASGMFGRAETDLMMTFSVQAAVSIENTRLVRELLEQDRIKQELLLGRRIQMGLVPKKIPIVEGLVVRGMMEPAKEIGGDYFDFLERTVNGQKRLGVAIGDVSGKGLGAGLTSAIVKTTLTTLSREGLGLRDILTKANRVVNRNIRDSMFVSLVYLEWTPAERRVRFCGAGHEHILVYRGKTGAVEAIPTGGLVMGIMPDIEDTLNEQTFELEPSDKVLLYTDGVTEAFNDQRVEYGLEQLVDAVKRLGSKPAAELIAAVREDVGRFVGACEQSDDITLVALECKAQ